MNIKVDIVYLCILNNLILLIHFNQNKATKNIGINLKIIEFIIYISIAILRFGVV